MGDLEQLAQLVIDRSAALILYARQWMDNSAAAEDVVQEALTSLLVQRPPPLDPIAWMYRAVRNAAIDQSRSAASRRRRERAVAKSRREWFEPGAADALMDGAVAHAALEELPSATREIVVLRIWSDLSFAQIAAVTQMSLSTVHDRYVAALREMRMKMEKQSCSPKNTTTT